MQEKNYQTILQNFSIQPFETSSFIPAPVLNKEYESEYNNVNKYEEQFFAPPTPAEQEFVSGFNEAFEQCPLNDPLNIGFFLPRQRPPKHEGLTAAQFLKLEKNRQAAYRCRQKKQKKIEDLTAEVARLKAEVARLKASIKDKDQAMVRIQAEMKLHCEQCGCRMYNLSMTNMYYNDRYTCNSQNNSVEAFLTKANLYT